MGFVVHTSAFTAHSSAIPGKLWFLGNFNSNIGHYNVPVGGGVICRPVIPERGLSRASHLVGLTVEGWHSQTTCTAMPGKLWFPRNWGTNMPENTHFRIEKTCRGYPLRLGTFSTFGSWRPSGFCSPYKCLHGP